MRLRPRAPPGRLFVRRIRREEDFGKYGSGLEPLVGRLLPVGPGARLGGTCLSGPADGAKLELPKSVCLSMDGHSWASFPRARNETKSHDQPAGHEQDGREGEKRVRRLERWKRPTACNSHDAGRGVRYPLSATPSRRGWLDRQTEREVASCTGAQNGLKRLFADVRLGRQRDHVAALRRPMSPAGVPYPRQTVQNRSRLPQKLRDDKLRHAENQRSWDTR